MEPKFSWPTPSQIALSAGNHPFSLLPWKPHPFSWNNPHPLPWKPLHLWPWQRASHLRIEKMEPNQNSKIWDFPLPSLSSYLTEKQKKKEKERARGAMEEGRLLTGGTNDGYAAAQAARVASTIAGFRYLQDMDKHVETLGEFIKSRGYSDYFQKTYLVPMCSSIWSCSPERVMQLSAFSVLSFCHNHHLLQLSGRPQWLTVRGPSHCYDSKLREELKLRGTQIKINCEVHSVITSDNGRVRVYDSNGSQDEYDGCIMAVSAPNAMKILGKEATHDEIRILGAFLYIQSDLFLHHDESFMPQNKTTWSALNFVGNADGGACLTYFLNLLQNTTETSHPCLMTLNPPHSPKEILHKWSTLHIIPSVAATKALSELDRIQGKRGIWFSGAYDQGNGFHEDALKAGIIAANSVLGRRYVVLKNPKQMVPSWTEAAARRFVIKFLNRFISAGCLILVEDGGDVLTFEGSDKRCNWKTVVRVHSPKFYWKIATEADFGLADAFVNGDISVVDKNEGLLNLFRICIANLHLYPRASKADATRCRSEGWWRPIYFTAAIGSAKYFYKHLFRRNSLTQARQNVARHYDLSNEMFSHFLDEAMVYSCGIFKTENEDLKVAQLRKIHLLIDKARVEKHHELLEIGCGWGSLGIEVVKKTGCRYTGITLSEEQLKFAQQKVNEAGLQDHIKFLLCDYRQLPSAKKYDRIISCEMLEQVGDEYYEDFFRQCDSHLADNGIVVVQTISIPDKRFDGHKRTSDFLREYIFPGGCLPSLSRLTSAMVAISTLCVDHVENIGQHYVPTLRCWRKNFLENQSKITSLGFDDKFMRGWEYYFDYFAAGFMTRILGDYQIVFSRQGNLDAFSDPCAGTASVHSCS